MTCGLAHAVQENLFRRAADNGHCHDLFPGAGQDLVPSCPPSTFYKCFHPLQMFAMLAYHATLFETVVITACQNSPEYMVFKIPGLK